MSIDEKPEIPKSFWKENPLHKDSFARLSYMMMIYLASDNAKQMMAGIINKNMTSDHVDTYFEESEKIRKLSSAEEAVKFMRQGCAGLLLNNLAEKVEDLEEDGEDVVSLILQRYQTSTQKQFIDTAAYVLSQLEPDFIFDLERNFSEIRSPYARSIACILFGAFDYKGAIPLLMDEYQSMKNGDYDDYGGPYIDKKSGLGGGYEEGPLLALRLLYEKPIT